MAPLKPGNFNCLIFQVEDMQMKMNQKDRKLKKMMQQMTASHQEDVKRVAF